MAKKNTKPKQTIIENTEVITPFRFVAKNLEQQRAWEAIAVNDYCFLTGCAGSGKAQPLTCKVLTPSGFVLMKDIHPGDLVCTPDGGVSKVGGVFPQGVRNVYRITFSDGSQTRCCEEHLWKIKVSQHLEPCVANLQYVMRHYRTKPGYHAENGKRVITIPMTQPVAFPKRDYVIHPYVLGVIIGDGCITANKIEVTSADQFIAEECNRLLDDEYALVKTPSSKYGHCLRRKVKKCSPNMYVEELRRLGLMGKKSTDKHIPHEYLYGAPEDRIELLRGLMDTDGHAGVNSTEVSFSCKQLADDFKILVQSLGGTLSTSCRKTKCNDSYRMHICMPNEINPFKMPRKATRCRRRTRVFPHRLFDKIEYIGQEECQCIFVDDNKHLYITDDFIVTHNTTCAMSYGIQNHERYDKIIIARPAVESGESLGYLPGDLNQKLHPFLTPIFDAIEKTTRSSANFKDLIGKKVEVVPLAYARGRTFERAFCILDEAQNAEPAAIEMYMTRLGEGSKMVLCGDDGQPDIDRCVLQDVARAFSEANQAGWVEFTESVRHPRILQVIKIMAPFKQMSNKKGRR